MSFFWVGTKHKEPRILRFVSDLLPRLHDVGITHLGLEVAGDQQGKIDRYIEEGAGLDKINLGSNLDCPEYRNLIRVMRRLRHTGWVEVVALDLPRLLYRTDYTRDEWMAKSISEMFDSNPNARVLVIVGDLHILKKIVWERHVTCNHPLIPGYLAKLRPDLRMFSIYQAIDESHKRCDFCRKFGGGGKPVAVDCNGPFHDWRLGVIEILAAKPLPAGKLADGVIVY